MPDLSTNDQAERQGGYTAAASWIARDPDSETFVFRKFDKLAAVNLLYLQSEILDLEKRLEEMHLITIGSYDMNLRDAASTWETLVSQCQGDGARQDAKERMRLIRELRQLLREYHETLLLQSQVAQLKRPESRVLAALRNFFQSPHHILGGKAKSFLNNSADLVALKTPAEVDYLSSFLRRNWVKKKEMSRDGVNQYGRFEEKSITLAVNIVTVAIAAIFLVGSIIGFYHAQGSVTKLCMIAGFTVAFAASVGLITNARRVEIFAATAAYAAVLVVFVSNGALSPN
ncbi:hypothetical protein B0H63DRAFT_464808 [Podospora didyma]|uniref:DUF6594 domain-containing protein n=1 Tax=Podospora didyma TaxID=330526 RepID=A0AAE0NYP0_9PEZI|nr:hypothetical protein B0H63DRAFT_464808 [Podospora didyma]